MPFVDGQHDGRQLLLSVAVLASDNPSDLSHVTGRALLDTGATVSGLGPRIIGDLGLRSYGKKLLGSATELRMVSYFFFRLGLFPDGDGTLPFIFAEIDGFGWPESKGFDIILGMDVLKQCDLSIGRSGDWRLDFG